MKSEILRVLALAQVSRTGDSHTRLEPVGAKTDGTFENIGEIIENVISLKTILTPNAKKAERVVNSASIILNSTNKTLDDKEKN